MPYHKNLTTSEGIHYIQNWEVATVTAMNALVVSSDDEGKVCRVTADDSFYVLEDSATPTWAQLNGDTSDFMTKTVYDTNNIGEDVYDYATLQGIIFG